MIKVAVPWPVKEASQPRIREALSLWEDTKPLLVCLVRPCDDPFLEGFDKIILSRDSTSIGTTIPKCFIYDMVKAAKDLHPGMKWYGFGNSDLVPVGNLVDGHDEYEVLVYHRTDIVEWEHRFRKPWDKPVDKKIADQIWEMRQNGVDDRKLARHLNKQGILPPPGYQEWTYANIRELFIEQGKVFFWGQDMYLFREDIVDRVLEEYLKPKDPILGTGGFDPRLTRWVLENFKGARIVNKIFHKEHPSEWSVQEVEYNHNGGDIPYEELAFYYHDDYFIQTLCDNGQRGAVPKYIYYLVSKNNPNLHSKL
jgi:hypothetical protein